LPIERLGALDNVVLKAAQAAETKAGATRENTSRSAHHKETLPDSTGSYMPAPRLLRFCSREPSKPLGTVAV